MKGYDFPKYLSSYLSKYLPGQKNASKNTITSYCDTFKLFLTFCGEKKKMKPEKICISDITKELVVEYLGWLESRRECSISTRNQPLAVIHSFFHYVQKESPENLHEIQKILSIPVKKHPKTTIPYLTGNETQILLAQPTPSSYEGYRDMVLLSVLYDTGARVQELVDIKVKDVRLTTPAVVILHGKGSKIRTVPIIGRTTDLLKTYLDKKKYHAGIAKGDNYLFVNQKQQQLSRWGISYILDKYVEMAKGNLEFQVSFPVTPHVLRHSKSMHLL